MSNQPPEYNRQYNFENFQTINPTSPLPGDKVEAELNSARSSINQTISRLNEIQNADGSLKTPSALATETTATATSVATSVATSTAQAYLNANYDPTIATQAAASASAAATSAGTAMANSLAAATHEANAELASQNAVNAAIDASIARASARSSALDANESKNEAHASAQAAAASYADVGQVYNSALSLKNWIDSEAYEFVHKREELHDVMANLLYNDCSIDNTLIEKRFTGATISPNSEIKYTPPTNISDSNNGPWWVHGHIAPEEPHRIITRDMMSCLVDTWLTFGPRIYPHQQDEAGNLKEYQEGINGAPPTVMHEISSSGITAGRIRGVNYAKANFGVGANSPLPSPLAPRSYVDEKDYLMSQQIAGKANNFHTHSISDVSGLQQALEAGGKIADYDNGKTYSEGDQVIFADKIYKFNAFIGAAGYGPDTHPEAWTELSSGASGGIVTGTIEITANDGLYGIGLYPSIAGSSQILSYRPNEAVSITPSGIQVIESGMLKVGIDHNGFTFPDGTTQNTAAVSGNFLPLSGGNVTGNVTIQDPNSADPTAYILLRKQEPGNATMIEVSSSNGSAQSTVHAGGVSVYVDGDSSFYGAADASIRGSQVSTMLTDNRVGYCVPVLATQFSGLTNGSGAVSDHFNAITNATNSATRRLFAPNTGAGYAVQQLDLNFLSSGVDHFATMRGFSWNRRMIISFSLALGSFASTGDLNTVFGVKIGFNSTSARISSTPIGRGICLYKRGHSNNPMKLEYRKLDNGITSEVVTGFNPGSGIVYDVVMEFNGSGNFKLYVNNLLYTEGDYAPSEFQPVTSTYPVQSALTFSCENTATPAVRASAVISNVKITTIQ